MDVLDSYSRRGSSPIGSLNWYARLIDGELFDGVSDAWVLGGVGERVHRL